MSNKDLVLGFLIAVKAPDRIMKAFAELREEERPKPTDDIRRLNISALFTKPGDPDFNVRIQRTLEMEGIKTVGDLLNYDPKKLSRFRFGPFPTVVVT